MALKRTGELSAAQWQIIHYSRLSNVGISVAVGITFLTHALAPVEGNARIALTALVATASGVAWVHFDRWCHAQVLCPVCRQSIFYRWIIEIWVGFSRWFSNVPNKCATCGARLG